MKGIRNRGSGVLEVEAGCYGCDPDGEARWTSRNAMGVAARHAAATGHYTWWQQILGGSYNNPRWDSPS